MTNGKSGKNRTHIYGFGDHRVTITPHSYVKRGKAPVDVKTLIYIVPIQYIHERR